MKVFYKTIFFLLALFFFCRCTSETETKPANEDSIINALNAADTIPKILQKVTDSINKAYLDSLKKHAADNNNAEYGSPH